MIPTFRKSILRDPNTGEDKELFFLNQASDYVKGTLLVPADGGTGGVTTLAVAPAATIPTLSPPLIIEGDEGAVSEVYSLIANYSAASNADAQDRLTVLILDSAWRRRLMNRAILANHVFGQNRTNPVSGRGPLSVGARQPFFLDESIFLEGQQTLQFEFFNNSTGGGIDVSFALETRKFQQHSLIYSDVSRHIQEMRQRKLFYTPYWLTTEQAISIPASGSVTAFFTSSRDNMLVLFKSICTALTTGVAGDTEEIIEIRLFDAETERALQNQPFTLNTGTGTAAFPCELEEPLIMPPFTKIRVELTNLITDAATEVFFTLAGVAVYTGARDQYQRTIGIPENAPEYMGAQ